MYCSSYFRGQMLTPNDMWPAVEIRDITELVDDRLFSPIPADRHDFKRIGIIADPGAGKTQLAISLAKKAFDRYGADSINIIYDRDVNRALRKMDSRPVQFMIIDDASGAQNSRTAYENIDAIQNVVLARHLAGMAQEGASRARAGIVFLVWAWQYYLTLEKNFRKVHYAFLKTYENERNTDYSQLLGGYSDILRKNTLKIEACDQSAKCYSLCAIPSMFQDGNRYAGRGVYTSSIVTDFPEFPDTRLVEKAPIKPIDEYFKGIDPEKLFRAREIAYMLSKGMTQAQAGELWGYEQPDVSKLLKWYRNLGGIKDGAE